MNTSIQYISDSANLGYADAQYALGWAFLTENSGVTRNVSEAIKWIKIASEQGHIEARKSLDFAMQYSSKNDVDLAFSEAEKWIVNKSLIVANESDQSATKIEKDYQNTAALFLKAANQGRASAQYHLGTFLMQCKGAQQNYEQAAMWFRKAAEQGHAEAQNSLGMLYRENHGVPQDYEQAALWFRKAAKLGLSDAECNMGLLYSSGQGVQKDIIEACKWFLLASAGGFPGALKHLEFFEKNLTPSQIAEATQRASSWMIESLKNTGVQVVEVSVKPSNIEAGVTKSRNKHGTFFNRGDIG